jgi:hypothetical protein
MLAEKDLENYYIHVVSKISTNYKQVFVNEAKTRFILVDEFGNKSKIVLKTKSGKYITRTEQFIELKNGKELTRITYKGKSFFVTVHTVLED